MIYLFSPVLLKNVYLKIGIKNSLLASVIGTLIIQIIFQFSLEPLLVYGLLIIEGFLIGLFWPILITSISMLSKTEGVCEDEGEQDKLISRYNVSWNSGAIFSYMIGPIFLVIIDFVELIFTITLIYSALLVIFTFAFENPSLETDMRNEMTITSEFKASCMKENITFPSILPLYIIAFYGFLIGSLILLYPIKSEVLNFANFTTF
jgi:MFS family permease